MKTFCIGDIHGSYKALLQCFERSGFNYSHDRLIVLGDVCDGCPEVKNCIDELLKIKNCQYVMGNHDLWALKWAQTGWNKDIWLTQGGRATVDSYGVEKMPPAHIDFLKSAPFYFEYEGLIFVHGGFDPQKPVSVQEPEGFAWDRTLINLARKVHGINPEYKLGEFKEIFLGHTPTVKFDSSEPLKFCNVWDVDTGAGLGEKLSIMDVETKEFWQSDPIAGLYPRTAFRK
jgi:serine/threonine protein phosphatase 1